MLTPKNFAVAAVAGAMVGVNAVRDVPNGDSYIHHYPGQLKWGIADLHCSFPDSDCANDVDLFIYNEITDDNH